MLRLTDICKTFLKNTPDEKVLFDNFNLHINEGEFVSVVGSNGSGKTSMLNIISGDLSIDGGRVEVGGTNVTGLENYRRAKKIARVFQDPSLGTCATMTIFENLSIADNKLKPYNLSRGLNFKRRDFYRSQLELLGLGLENRMDAQVSTLSGGQRQALALIMATMVTPHLLLLDEHTAALDPKSSDTVMNLTQKVIIEKKITTLMVTHNLRHAVDYGNRMIMMHQGKTVIDDAGKEKESRSTEQLLKVFNEISIECGN